MTPSSSHAPAFRRLLILVTLASLGLTAAARPQRKKSQRPVRPKAVAQTMTGIENAQALRPFFTALTQLEAAGSDRVVRVMQFGDSHTAADFWTGRVRHQLQARFGDGGPGLILPAQPWRGYHHEGVDLLEGRGWSSTSLREKISDGLVGFTGAALFPPQEGSFRLRAAFGEYRVQMLGEGLPEVSIYVAADPFNFPAVPAPRQPAPIPPLFEKSLENRQRLRILGESGLPASVLQELSITFPSESRFLGVDLRSGHSGVIYDELGLNGAELPDLERWNVELRRALLTETHPDLLVLAYGTNDLGRQDLDPQDYATRARVLFTTLKQESGAAILVIGPLDRIGIKRRQVAGLKAGAARIIRSLRAAALASGCAFWDARKAMGGEGSILKWRRAGLAQRDLVHLTGPGYQRLGNQMTEALMSAFERLGSE